ATSSRLPVRNCHRGPALKRRAYSRGRAGVSYFGSIEIETSRAPPPTSPRAPASDAPRRGRMDGQGGEMNCRTARPGEGTRAGRGGRQAGGRGPGRGPAGGGSGAGLGGGEKKESQRENPPQGGPWDRRRPACSYS